MSLHHGSSIPKDNLILYLDAANSKSYSGGSEWRDLSKNQRKLTIVGDTPPPSSGYIQFNGVNNRISNPISNSEMINTNPITSTYIVWAYIEPGRSRNMLSWAFSDGLILEARQTKLVFYNGSQGNYINTEISVTGEWKQIIQRDNGKDVGDMEMFVNGEMVYSRLSGVTYGLGKNQLFANYGGGGDHFLGKVATVQMYNRALSDDEIAQTYHTFKGRYGL